VAFDGLECNRRKWIAQPLDGEVATWYVTRPYWPTQQPGDSTGGRPPEEVAGWPMGISEEDLSTSIPIR